jgi:hypothetical protein
MAVNPRHLMSRIKSYTVNIRYMTCRICDIMRLVMVFRIETVVLQVSKIMYLRHKLFDPGPFYSSDIIFGQYFMKNRMFILLAIFMDNIFIVLTNFSVFTFVTATTVQLQRLQ